jgi:two-component system, sensor histidine kinase
MTEETERLRSRAERERRARKDAEMLLEAKSRELYGANQLLKYQAEALESVVAARTAELANALHHAQAATEAKSIFFASISHEIRTPLNGIIGITDLLAMDINDPTQRHHLDLLRISGETLLSLVNDLLDFSKIEANHLKLEERSFDLIADLQATATLQSHAARAKNITLSTRFQPLSTHVIGDSLRLRQIATNLLSNAIKFTEQGEVWFDTTWDDLDADHLQFHMRVKDSGIGIPQDLLPQLFEPFSQAETSTTRRFGGTGLGLAIVKQLSVAMGGSISVKSLQGQGSEFHCTVKLRKGLNHELTQQVPSSTNPPVNELLSVAEEALLAEKRKDLKILVVDDNHINQTLAIHLMRKMGYWADVASSGSEAIDCCLVRSYDVILMDVQMPGMDGLEATRRIRGLDLPRQPWIVALTANVSEEDRQRCLDAGMEDFLTKPFRGEALRQYLDTMTGRLQVRG